MKGRGRSRSPRRRSSAVADGDPFAEGDLSVEVEMFIAENNIDETAGAALRDQAPIVQRACIDEGPVTGRNTSAILMGRLKRSKAKALDQMRADVAPVEEKSEDPDALERFIQDNGIDQTAADVLREQVPEVQRAVIEEGSLTGRNPSAIMMGRLKRAKAAATAPAATAPNAWGPPAGFGAGGGQVVRARTAEESPYYGSTRRLAPQHGQSHSSQQTPRAASDGEDLSMEVEMFIAENSIDETAGAALREQDPSVQRSCIDEGEVTGRNTSAILMGRIKRCKVKLQSSVDPSALERFIEENGIDENAAGVLREQAPEVQRAVVEEGSVTGRNASATMMGRIKRAKAAASTPNAWMPPGGCGAGGGYGGGGSYDAGGCGYGGAGFGGYSAPPAEAAWAPALGPQQTYSGCGKGGCGKGGSPMIYGKGSPMSYGGSAYGKSQWTSPVQAFIEQNGIDEHAGANLLSQPPAVQQAVVDEGPLTGRNPNAVLNSRIKRIMANGGQSPATAMQPQNFSAMHHQQDMGEDPVEQFLVQNGIDEGASDSLRQAPRHIQRKVVEEGDIRGRNPSAILLSRIRRAGR